MSTSPASLQRRQQWALRRTSRQGEAHHWCPCVGWVANLARRPASKLKPNTRFLRHIIKETKSHNEALLAKEAADAQARLDSLAQDKTKKRRKQRPDPRDIRERQLGDISAILQGRKRRRPEADDDPTPKKIGEDEQGAESPKRLKPVRPHHRRYGSQNSPALEPRVSADSELDEASHRKHSRGRHGRRAASILDEPRNPGRWSKRRLSRSPERLLRPRSRRSQSPDRHEEDVCSHHHTPKPKKSNKDVWPTKRNSSSKAGRRPGRDEQDDSDPLDETIGPRLPSPAPARYRGRGAKGALSGVETRFSEGYDPSTDVEPEPSGDGWEVALEAFRDRQKWKQQGATRLRDAGFSDEHIKKWERSGGEKDVNDVKWSKQGEGREWDRGKPDKDGNPGKRPEWPQ